MTFMDKVAAQIISILEKSPNLIGSIIVVAGFLFYLDRSDQRDQIAAEGARNYQVMQGKLMDRHTAELITVVERSNTALELNAEASSELAKSNVSLVQRFNEFARDRYATTRQQESVIDALDKILERITLAN